MYAGIVNFPETIFNFSMLYFFFNKPVNFNSPELTVSSFPGLSVRELCMALYRHLLESPIEDLHLIKWCIYFNCRQLSFYINFLIWRWTFDQVTSLHPRVTGQILGVCERWNRWYSEWRKHCSGWEREEDSVIWETPSLHLTKRRKSHIQTIQSVQKARGCYCSTSALRVSACSCG